MHVIKEKTYLTIPEIAEKFAVSKSFVYKKTARKDYPFFKIGRTILFDENEISDLLLENGRSEAVK